MGFSFSMESRRVVHVRVSHNATDIGFRVLFKNLGAKRAAESDHVVPVFDARKPLSSGNQFLTHRALHLGTIHIAGIEIWHTNMMLAFFVRVLARRSAREHVIPFDRLLYWRNFERDRLSREPRKLFFRTGTGSERSICDHGACHLGRRGYTVERRKLFSHAGALCECTVAFDLLENGVGNVRFALPRSS